MCIGDIVGLVALIGFAIFIYQVVSDSKKADKKEKEEAERKKTEPWPKLNDDRINEEVKQIYPLAEVYNNADAQYRLYEIFKDIDAGFSIRFLKRAIAQNHKDALVAGCKLLKELNGSIALTEGEKAANREQLAEWEAKLAEQGITSY